MSSGSPKERLQQNEVSQATQDLEFLKSIAVQLPGGFVKRRVVHLIGEVSEQISMLQDNIKEEKWKIRVRGAAQETILLTGLSPTTSLKDFVGLIYDATGYSSAVTSIVIDRTSKRILDCSGEGSLVSFGFQNNDSIVVEYGTQRQLASVGKIHQKLSSFQTLPSTSLEAVFLALHCCLLELGFICIAPMQTESSVPGFAPPLKGKCVYLSMRFNVYS